MIVNEETVSITDCLTGEVYAAHPLCHEKGRLIGQKREERDKSKSLLELKDFDLNFCQSITRKQLNQLAELTWIDGIYNLILSGPPGVGKTHLAIALAYQACEEGYRSVIQPCSP